MTNSLVVYEQFETLQRASMALYKSGYFKDATSEAQAIVKVMAGAELGLPPFASMTGIHIVQGKPVLGSNVIATLVKNSGRYDYRIKQADDAACIIVWYEHGKAVGEAGYTMDEAKAAGLAGKDTWKKFASDMLFARAISRGARRYAPGIFGGSPVYTPDEMGVDTDEDGYIEGEVVDVTPAPVEQKAKPAPEKAPDPDDEVVVREGKAEDFLGTVAALLNDEPDAMRARLKALGYTAVPQKAEARVEMYRKLKDRIHNELSWVDDDADDDATQPALVNTGDMTYAE